MILENTTVIRTSEINKNYFSVASAGNLCMSILFPILKNVRRECLSHSQESLLISPINSQIYIKLHSWQNEWTFWLKAFSFRSNGGAEMRISFPKKSIGILRSPCLSAYHVFDSHLHKSLQEELLGAFSSFQPTHWLCKAARRSRFMPSRVRFRSRSGEIFHKLSALRGL